MQFGYGIRFSELISIAEILISILHLPPLTRNMKRKYELLMKWYEDNFNIISQYLKYIQLLDNDKNEITYSREIFNRALK